MRTTQALAGVAFAAQIAPLLAAPEKRRFKIGACEWSLRKSDPSCFEVAKQIGLDGVEVDMGRAANGLHMRKPEVQRSYVEAAKRIQREKSRGRNRELAVHRRDNVPSVRLRRAG